MCSHSGGGGGGSSESQKPKAVSVAAPQVADTNKSAFIDNSQQLDIQKKGKRKLTIDLNSSGGTGLNI